MNVVAPSRRSFATLAAKIRAATATSWGSFLAEAAILLVVLLLFARTPLLDLDPTHLQRTGEHSEAATLHVVTEQALRAGVIPLWNPYMSSGFPVAGDFVSTFWNPVTTVPIALFGGVNGYKVSAFLSFFVAGLGQLALGRVLGLGRMARLWSALLFMLSGGMALYWRLGWHQLLVGLAWFPFAFAALIWALRSRRLGPLALAAVPIFMVFTSAGGYYFLYLGVALVAITLLMVALAPPGARVARCTRALAIALLAGGLSAVLLFPAVDVYRETVRETPGDPAQADSQPIVYALVNYLVAERSWFDSRALGQANGCTWFYVGALPFVGMLGLPLAASGTRRREALLLSVTLLALYLVWHANRHTPVGALYDAFPALYQFRFNGRLLAVATIPLLIVGGLGWQALLDAARRRVGESRVDLQIGSGGQARMSGFALAPVPSLIIGVLLLLSVWNVFEVNRPFAFDAPQARDLNPNRAIEWLHERDPGPYNIFAGDWRIWWHWTTAAYELKQPMLNFAYNRHTRSFIGQQHESHNLRASPRYLLPWNDSLPATLPLIGEEVAGQPVYEDPDALPYAFTIAPPRLANPARVVAADVRPAQARWLNPNQLLVIVEEGVEGEQLVALVSEFPGWKLYRDGKPLPLELVNRYLAAPVAAGEHTYLFSFEPPKFYLGLALSALTLLVVVGLIAAEPLAARRARRRPLTPRG